MFRFTCFGLKVCGTLWMVRQGNGGFLTAYLLFSVGLQTCSDVTHVHSRPPPLVTPPLKHPHRHTQRYVTQFLGILFTFFLDLFTFILCIRMFCHYVCMYTLSVHCLRNPEGDIISSRTEVTDACEPLCGC